MTTCVSRYQNHGGDSGDNHNSLGRANLNTVKASPTIATLKFPLQGNGLSVTQPTVSKRLRHNIYVGSNDLD